ncbi:hypothetical protein [Paenibacillus senegalimassiliensis]|uniref:hypothetical protein n=1 Tax=Paenibacillus senegalimassiliensis TaxID=1737426 RepID=UPI000A49A3FD|nr:hypothetical protein [Paenibacillus senegalimassiliensis]
MRQSAKSRDWQATPLVYAGGLAEARSLARLAAPEQFEMIPREIKPSAEWLPRPGS